ncbi:unnamed protein product [Umbelopsis sp. WA50703]
MLAIVRNKAIVVTNPVQHFSRIRIRAVPAGSFRLSTGPARWSSSLPNVVPIRGRYYNDADNSLSRAMQRQKNPFVKFGRRLNNTSPNIIIWTVIGTNVSVFLMWQYAISSYQQFRDARWLQFMMKHFMVHQDSLANGRWHNLLTASISHKDTTHLGVNMLVLYTMGMGVIEAIGASRFLLLYGASGIASSLAHIGYQKYILPRLQKRELPPTLGSLGASGSVMGITTFFACAFPRATFLVFFIVPMPAIAVVGLFAAYDIYKASTVTFGTIDSAGHIGGAMYGAGYWFLRVKPMLRAGRWRL